MVVGSRLQAREALSGPSLLSSSAPADPPVTLPFAAKTLPVPCDSTAFVAKTVPFLAVTHLPTSRARTSRAPNHPLRDPLRQTLRQRMASFFARADGGRRARFFLRADAVHLRWFNKVKKAMAA